MASPRQPSGECVDEHRSPSECSAESYDNRSDPDSKQAAKASVLRFLDLGERSEKFLRISPYLGGTTRTKLSDALRCAE
jgi:hypothetical protein